MKKMSFRVFGFLIGIAVLFAACILSQNSFKPKQTVDLTGKVRAESLVIDPRILKEKSDLYLDFSIRLFKENIKNSENTMVSPFSVLCAMGMAVNGADNNTLKQLEDGIGMTSEEINEYLYSYMQEVLFHKKAAFQSANSIWIKDHGGFSENKDFLTKNISYFQSSVYKSAFDEETLKEINLWISEKTNGTIKDVLNKISDRAVVYLINALCFEAKWDNIYHKAQVREGVDFRSYSGKVKKVKMLSSNEYTYLSDEDTTGFIKPYDEGDFLFIALLPNKNKDIKDYIKTMDKDKLRDLLSHAKSEEVLVNLPSFEFDYGNELSSVFQNLKVTDAFDQNLADFSKMGKMDSGDTIYISKIIHKTHITVDEQGTKAGAATVVEKEAGAVPFGEPKEVILDRPFVFMIVEGKTNTPVFIGNVMDIGE